MIASHSTKTALGKRTGATLTEVLMAILIMSIGVVSTFTLFPVSILSSIRANQLTNSKILEQNVRELIRNRPELLTGCNYWKPNLNYTAANGIVIPRPKEGLVFDRNQHVFVVVTPGTSGFIEPNWESDTVQDGDVIWQRASLDSRYLIDVLGRELITLPSTYPNTFGNNGTDFIDNGVPRIDLRTTLDLTYENLSPQFSLPDSWTPIFENFATILSANEIQFPPDAVLDGVTATSMFRVIASDPDRIRSIERGITAVNGNRLTLSSNLPNDLGAGATPLLVRLESFTPRYSWLLSVNQNLNGRRSVQCVVIFNRSFNIADEHVYLCNFDSTAPNTLRVNIDAAGPQPLIREGGYVWDQGTNRWIEIVNVSNLGAFSVTPQIELKEAIQSNSNDPRGIVFQPGVIKVFDLDQ